MDKTKDPNLSSHSRTNSFTTLSKRPSSTKKHTNEKTLEIKHNSGAHTVSERKSKHKDRDHNSGVEEIFVDSPKKKNDGEKRLRMFLPNY